MSRDQNKAIARRFIQARSAGGLHVVDELAAPDMAVAYSHYPAPYRGVEQVKQMLRQTYARFPDIRVAVDEVLAEGDTVVVRWTYRGSHQHGEMFVIAPTGKWACVSGITTYQMRAGKVVEKRGLVDVFGLMQQLSAVPAPGQEGHDDRQ